MVSFLGSGPSSEASSSVSSRSTSSTDLSCELPSKSTPQAKEVNPLNPQGIKPCCACPETKALRDECFLKSSPDVAGEKCRELVEAHKACMRGYGFKV